MGLRVIAVGRKHEDWIKLGLERYQKRLKRPFELEWVLLPHSKHSELTARQDESKQILARIKPSDYAVLLDERGELIDSPGLARRLLVPLERSQSVVLVIGGAYGVDETIHRRADFVWSLSPLVLPHQLVRLVLVEQLYRAQEIAAGRPYHHV